MDISEDINMRDKGIRNLGKEEIPLNFQGKLKR